MVMLVEDPTFLHSVLAMAPIEANEELTVAFVLATEALPPSAEAVLRQQLRREVARGIITGPSLSHRLSSALGSHATELGRRIDPHFRWAQAAWRAFEAGRRCAGE